MTTDKDITTRNQIIDHVRELLSTHWREAKDSADDEGKFAIGLRISVQNGAPAKQMPMKSHKKSPLKESSRSMPQARRRA